jgi:hypothetical protein
MKRLLLAAAIATAALSPAAALGHKGNHGSSRAKTLKATLKPVRADVAAYSGMSGKADMVANKRNAKVNVHLRGLVPGASYGWAVVKGDSADTVCASGTPLANWKYKPALLKAGKKGNANGAASSKHNKFRYDSSATYAVVVYQTGTANEVLLCGVFKGKSKKKANSHKPNTKHPVNNNSGKGKGH